MFQDVAELCEGLVREVFYMHQFVAFTQSNVGVSLLAIGAVHPKSMCRITR
jgi:hypothetical protein